MRTALYPGTFDPITNGHVDIIARAREQFDKVIVIAAVNAAKSPLFTLDERVQLIRDSVKGISNVTVDSFDGLIVNYAVTHGATAIVRGLRAISDFEYEFQMALMNRKLASTVETVFLMPGEKYTYLNSTIIREVAQMKGDVSEFVPAGVMKKLREKFGG